MPLRQSIIVTLISLAAAAWVLELARRRRLKEEYALLWLGGCAVGLVCAWWYNGLVTLTAAMGIAIPTSTVFFLALVVLGLICLHFSVRISELTEKTQRLAQELALQKADQAKSTAGRRPKGGKR